MKNLRYFTLPILVLSLGILFQSCKNEVEEPVTIQERLKTETPLEIFNSGVSLDKLYGKSYQGGLIFYLNTTDGTGMVAAPSDVGGKNASWGCKGTDLPNLDNVTEFPTNPETAETARLGAGSSNSETILADCTEDDIAAKLCADLVLAGQDDWFLPSREELSLAYQHLAFNDMGDFELDFYLTSTEYDADNVWAIAFDTGSASAVGKVVGFRVRPVREF